MSENKRFRADLESAKSDFNKWIEDNEIAPQTIDIYKALFYIIEWLTALDARITKIETSIMQISIEDLCPSRS